MSLDLAVQMRQAMRRLTSGVSVLSSVDSGAKRYAMTASSVTSVSDDPPSLLVCVHRSASIDRAIQDSNKFTVNMLAAEQEDLSNLCADPEKVDQRFVHKGWRQDRESELWYLASSPAVVFCELTKKVAHGTHNIFVGNITNVLINDTF